MSKTLARALRIAVIAVAAASCQAVMAQDVTIVGPVTKIVLAADGASAVATLKDGKSGEEVPINISDELTLDKFKDKLRGNKDALMSKHQCRTVRFAVYVKDGRAALKATPIRD